MKIPAFHRDSKKSAFTLIELIVVISIIAILASLIFPVIGAIDRKKKLNVARTELNQIETAIEGYKAKYGSYPPSNPLNVKLNPLLLELVGSTKINATPTYRTLDGGAQLTYPADFSTLFGAAVQGLVNTGTGAQGDDAQSPQNFLKNLRPTQIGQFKNAAGETANAVLLCSVKWSGPSPILPAGLLLEADANP